MVKIALTLHVVEVTTQQQPPLTAQDQQHPLHEPALTPSYTNQLVHATPTSSYIGPDIGHSNDGNFAGPDVGASNNYPTASLTPGSSYICESDPISCPPDPANGTSIAYSDWNNYNIHQMPETSRQNDNAAAFLQNNYEHSEQFVHGQDSIPLDAALRQLIDA